MSAAQVQVWVEGYRRAWESNDPAEVAALFTADATYLEHPLEEPVRGRDAIVADWLDRRDEPGRTTFRFEVVAVDGEVAVVRGWTTYLDPPAQYANLWVLHLDPEGRCSSFTEWWMERRRTSPS